MEHHVHPAPATEEQLDLFWRARLIGGPLNGKELEIAPGEDGAPPPYIHTSLNYNPKMTATYRRGAISPSRRGALYFIFAETDKHGAYL